MNDEFEGTENQDNAASIAYRHVIERTKHLTSLRSYDKRPEQPVVQHRDESDTIDAEPVLPRYTKRKHPVLSTRSSAYVEPFARDYARIIHSASFRRLQGKTQLIPAGENEFFRTRLTHSLEVAEIATRIARKLNAEYAYFRKNPIDYDLVACAALLHDIGHPPFGHSGEYALNQKMKEFGGFEGNAQTLRMVTNIENRLEGASETEEPIGLNLTAGTLASILKYDQLSGETIYDELSGEPIKDEQGNDLIHHKGFYKTEEDTVNFLHETLDVDKRTKLLSIECQIMDLADDIAYSAYDFEDTLEAGIITPLDFMSIEDKVLDTIQKDVYKRISKRKTDVVVTQGMIIAQLSNVFGTLLEPVEDYNLDNKWGDRLAFVGRTYAESVQHGRNPLIRRKFLEEVIEKNINAVYVEFDREKPFLSILNVDFNRLVLIEAMKSFNFIKIISSRRLQLQHARNREIIGKIFNALVDEDGSKLLSDVQRERFDVVKEDPRLKRRFVADIIANFTDGEALNFYDQLHSTRNARFWSYIR